MLGGVVTLTKACHFGEWYDSERAAGLSLELWLVLVDENGPGRHHHELLDQFVVVRREIVKYVC